VVARKVPQRLEWCRHRNRIKRLGGSGFNNAFMQQAGSGSTFAKSRRYCQVDSRWYEFCKVM